MTMRTPRTRSGREIVARLVDHAEAMARDADEADVPSYLRTVYSAKAETYRLVAEWLPSLIARAEHEAVELEIEENARLDAALETVA